MDCLTPLPDELHHTIFKYLSYREKITIISCKSSFHRLFCKKERVIQLSGLKTLQFFCDLDFQQKILEKIDSPLDQLILEDNGHLYYPLSDDDDLLIPHLNGLKTLILPIDVYVMLNESYPDAIPVVQNLHLSLNVQEEIEGDRILPFLPRVTKSIQFDALQNLPHELSFSSTIEELSFDNCYEIGKISSPLPNLRVVKLIESCIGNLNDFQHLQELTVDELQVSEMTTDYSALITAKKLRIENCESLSDISFLQENEEITMRDCSDITNYTHCFQKSKKITIEFSTPSDEWDVDVSHYSQVEEFNLVPEENNIVLSNGLATGIIPPTLKRLTLYGVCGFEDLSGFEHLKKVSIVMCPDITTLIGLEHIPSVSLQGLSLTSLEGLGQNKDVRIESCDKITDFSLLKYVNRVTIAYCNGFTDSSHLDHVSKVIILSCHRLEDVSGFRNAESVTLISCPLVKSGEALKDVKKLTVTN